MDHYIVRIYRKEKYRPESVTGMVEDIGKRRLRAFHGAEELLDILNITSEKPAQDTVLGPVTEKSNEH